DELRRQNQALDHAQEELADAERNLADMTLQFGDFAGRFQRRFAALYARLDEINAELAQLLAEHSKTDSAWDAYHRAEEQASRSRNGADATAERTEITDPPSDDLQRLYREAARKVHPDLARSDA